MFNAVVNENCTLETNACFNRSIVINKKCHSQWKEEEQQKMEILLQVMINSEQMFSSQ